MRSREPGLQESLSARDREIERKNKLIAEIDQALRLANSSIENLTQVQATLKEELDCATAQLQSLRREFDKLLQSRSWRYTALFRRIT